MSITTGTMSQEAFLRSKEDFVNRAFPIKDVPRVFRLENNYSKRVKGYQQVMFGELLQLFDEDDRSLNVGFLDLDSVDINMLECGPRLYKYLDEEAAEQNIKNGSIRFKEPSEWEDGFEKLYYQADYSKMIPTDIAKYTPRLNACCFTYQPETNAGWKMYRGNWGKTRGRVVCFEINEKRLLFELSKYAVKEGCDVYQGYIDYRIEADDIRELYKNDSKYHRIFFEDFSLASYLSLMLLKRKAFSYEQETRFFVIPNSNCVKGHIDIPVSLKNVVNRIILSPNYSQMKADAFYDKCKRYGLDCEVVISELKQKSSSRIEIEP